MPTKLKFYKNKTEAIKVLLPGSCLMLIAWATTLALTSASIIDNDFSSHVHEILKSVNIDGDAGFLAAVIVFAIFKIGAVFLEMLIAIKCLSLYRLKRTKTGKNAEKLAKIEQTLPRFKGIVITLSIVSVILTAGYVSLFFVDASDPLNVSAWQGILQSALPLLALTLLTPAVSAVVASRKNE